MCIRDSRLLCGWPALVGWRFLCVCAFDDFLLYFRIAYACSTTASLCNHVTQKRQSELMAPNTYKTPSPCFTSDPLATMSHCNEMCPKEAVSHAPVLLPYIIDSDHDSVTALCFLHTQTQSSTPESKKRTWAQSHPKNEFTPTAWHQQQQPVPIPELL